MGQPMQTVSLKLPRELDEALTELARKRGSTRSSLIREAIESYTAQHRRSVAEFADDLAGSLEGPDDLSSGAGHMSGYGE